MQCNVTPCVYNTYRVNEKLKYCDHLWDVKEILALTLEFIHIQYVRSRGQRKIKCVKRDTIASTICAKCTIMHIHRNHIGLHHRAGGGGGGRKKKLRKGVVQRRNIICSRHEASSRSKKNDILLDLSARDNEITTGENDQLRRIYATKGILIFSFE